MQVLGSYDFRCYFIVKKQDKIMNGQKKANHKKIETSAMAFLSGFEPKSQFSII